MRTTVYQVHPRKARGLQLRLGFSRIVYGRLLCTGLFSARLTNLARLPTGHVEYPLAGVERGSVYIEWTNLPGCVSALRDSPRLIGGDGLWEMDNFRTPEHTTLLATDQGSGPVTIR